jgi:DNA-directed RNA polymerase subunit RPC12/RpoP
MADTEVCWNCKKPTMKLAPKLGRGWYRCSNCGATHFPNPITLGESTLVIEKVKGSSHLTESRPRKRRQPKTPAHAK